jgi:hypothetical protein
MFTIDHTSLYLAIVQLYVRMYVRMYVCMYVCTIARYKDVCSIINIVQDSVSFDHLQGGTEKNMVDEQLIVT